MIVTSCPICKSDRVTLAPTLPPPATITYIGGLPLRGTARLQWTDIARPDVVGQDGDRRLGRAHRPQPPLRVEVRARRVEHAGDDAVDAEAFLDHLGDDDIRVVSVGRDHRGVGVLDPRL